MHTVATETASDAIDFSESESAPIAQPATRWTLLTRVAFRFSVLYFGAYVLTTQMFGSLVNLCSSSTPPGGGVHGMCGYHAARAALRDVLT